jgi:hypothetical protein
VKTCDEHVQSDHGSGALANYLNHMGQGFKQVLELGIPVISNPERTKKNEA